MVVSLSSQVAQRLSGSLDLDQLAAAAVRRVVVFLSRRWTWRDSRLKYAQLRACGKNSVLSLRFLVWRR